MTNSTAKKISKPITPIRPYEFQMAEHRYRQFDCTVPAGLKIKDLEDPALWVNVAPQLRQLDEVRAVAEDQTFVAYLIVLFSQGTDARLKVVSGSELEPEEVSEEVSSTYAVQLRGRKKFVLYNKKTGDIIKENIATKAIAYRELDDYVKAINA